MLGCFLLLREVRRHLLLQGVQQCSSTMAEVAQKRAAGGLERGEHVFTF